MTNGSPGGATAPALRLFDVNIPFGSGAGLSDVSLEVGRAERVVIVGPSGVGKTSLLRAVAGLGPVSRGAVEIDGMNVTHAPPERRGAVYLHQTPVLFPHLDVYGNVAFPLRIRGIDPASIRQRVAAALAAVQLGHLSGRGTSRLSGGQRHRVALARAIVARPSLLLLDEPMSSLDPALREEVRQAITRSQTESDAAMLLVTHDLDEAGLIGHRIGVLIDGRLAQLASPSVLFNRPVSLAVARAVGFVNFVQGRVAGREFHCALGTIPLPASGAADGPATLAFRSDAAQVAARTGQQGALRATVLQLQHRPGRTTAVVSHGDVTLEISVPADALPSRGETIPFEIRAGETVVLPADVGQ